MVKRNVTQIILLVGLFLIMQSAWALRLPENVDGDAIADAMEQWLLDQGVSVDDMGAAIVPGGANTYNDTDSDTIPDIIETNVTRTVVGENNLMPKIQEIKAHKIVNSRGVWTVDARITLDNGLVVEQPVPNGASRGEN